MPATSWKALNASVTPEASFAYGNPSRWALTGFRLNIGVWLVFRAWRSSCERHHIEEVKWKRLPIGMVYGLLRVIARTLLGHPCGNQSSVHTSGCQREQGFRQWSNRKGPPDQVWSESEDKVSWSVVLASEIFEAREGPGRVGEAFGLRFAGSPALGVTVYLLFLRLGFAIAVSVPRISVAVAVAVSGSFSIAVVLGRRQPMTGFEGVPSCSTTQHPPNSPPSPALGTQPRCFLSAMPGCEG